MAITVIRLALKLAWQKKSLRKINERKTTISPRRKTLTNKVIY